MADIYTFGVADSQAAVNSVSNSDGTLTISPTTGAVVASLNLGNANVWTANQQFPQVGIGMTPVNILDITQNQNGSSLVNLLNNSTGSGAQAAIVANNATHYLQYSLTGTGYSASGVYRQDGGYMSTNGAGGLSLITAAAQPIYFCTNTTAVGQFSSAGIFSVGGVAFLGPGASGLGGFSDSAADLASGVGYYLDSTHNYIVSPTTYSGTAIGTWSTCVRGTGLVVGADYVGTNPPSKGLAVEGAVGIGLNSGFGTNAKLTVNANGTADNLADTQLNAGAATHKALVIQGFASQTADLLEFQSSTGSVNSGFNSSGDLMLGATSVGGTNCVLQVGSNLTTDNLAIVQFNSQATTRKPLVVQGISGQTANLTEWQTSGGSKVAFIGPTGGGVFPYLGIDISIVPPGTYSYFQVAPNSTVDNLATTQLNTTSASTKTLVVQGFASQTANLTEWQNSSGTSMANIDHSGNITCVTGSINSNYFADNINSVIYMSTATGFNMVPRGTTTIPLTITCAASQTANAFTVNNNGNTPLTTINSAGLISKYNSVATAGWGIPAIYGAGRSTAQTAAVASVATYTVGAADGSFLVSANINVTTSSAEAFTATVSYTDETNTARVATLNFSNLAGTLSPNIAFANGAVPYEGVPLHIRCKASTAITVSTAAGGTYTGCTYNVGATIEQIQ